MPIKGRYTPDDETDFADDESYAADSVDSEADSGPGLGTALLTLAGVGAGAALLRRPGLVAPALRKVGSSANALRMGSMLSGLALPKSVLGNVGAAAVSSAERGSTAPLKELFSRQTGRDFMSAWRAGGQVAPGMPGAVPQSQLTKLNPFGRAMGAADVATQNALMRAGSSTEEAMQQVLQTPLHAGRIGKDFSEALDSPAAQWLIPFRRTPVNQFIEGLKILRNPSQHPKVLAGVGGAGFVHGAATAEEDYPMSIGLGTAATARYGLPYTLAAVAGRAMAGQPRYSGVMTNALPFSEYGMASAIGDPLSSFEPAGVRLLRRITGEE